MPLDLADDLYQHLLDRFPADRDYPRGALYVEGMPPLVASLLGRTLDRWLEHELDTLESRWFDFEDPGVRAARAELVVALGRTARVPRGAWAETLRYAVGLVVRHLATPARAITDATFEGQPDAIPTASVRSRLHTFEAYSYLPEIADAYLKQKNPESVDPDTLNGLLLRIDRRVTADYRAEDWLRLLGPLFKLSRHVPDRRGVPASLLAQFFAAKGKDAAAEELRQRGDGILDEATLREVLLGAHPESEEATSKKAMADEATPAADEHTAGEAEAEAPLAVEEAAAELEEADAQTAPVSSLPEDEVEDDQAEAAAEDVAAEIREDEELGIEDEVVDPSSQEPSLVPAPDEVHEPLWKRFASGPTTETAVPKKDAEPPAVSPPPPPAPRPAPQVDQDDAEPAPVWHRFVSGLRSRGGAADVEAPAGAPGESDSGVDLDTLEADVLGPVDRRARRRYVRDLFDGDEEAYADVLRRLSAADSWTEASNIIARDIFRHYGVDIYSESAVAFTDAVNGQF